MIIITTKIETSPLNGGISVLSAVESASGCEGGEESSMNEPVIIGGPSEHEIRVRWMRDAIFEQTSSDKNWEACRENWLRPDSVTWLEQRMKKR